MRSDIQAFLSLHRIAMVGVSQDPRHFSRVVFRAWRDRAFEVVPVNPKASAIEGVPCYPTPGDVLVPVEAAVVMTPPAGSEQAVKDCAAAGIRHIWLYRHSPEAESFCKQNGIDFIAGECPMMYLSDIGWLHRVHRWFHGDN